MKRWLLATLVAIITGQASAQDLKMSDVFKQMPDSLMPYLTTNNRLDFVDFMESHMKAEVTNIVGGVSEMTALSDDSLSIRMSEALRVDMLLLTLDEPLDSIRQVVVMAETFLVDSIYGETVCHTFSTNWLPLADTAIHWTAAQQKRIESLKLQNILNWCEDKLKKR